MGLDKHNLKIIVIVAVVVLIIGAAIGLLLGLAWPRQQYVELEVWPRSEEYTQDQPLIRVKPGDASRWAQRIDEFLIPYRSSAEAPGFEYRLVCSWGLGPFNEQVCDVPVHHYHPCTTDNLYNYQRGEPCIFLRLNQIMKWIPQPYNKSEDLPINMPEDLKQHIDTISGKPEANQVWVSCEGENQADVENIGPVQYIPRRGFPSFYYPFTNNVGYLSPLVAVLFEKPRTGVVINIECKAWAKNILYDRYERRGNVRFGLMVDRS